MNNVALRYLLLIKTQILILIMYGVTYHILYSGFSNFFNSEENSEEPSSLVLFVSALALSFVGTIVTTYFQASIFIMKPLGGGQFIDSSGYTWKITALLLWIILLLIATYKTKRVS